MNKEEKVNLKLIAKNHDDLKVLSAYLQDSIVSVKDIVFLKKNKTFIMIVNRFMWEDFEKGVFRENKRIRSAVKFEDVLKVKSKNINQKDKNKPLECLAIKTDKLHDETYQIKIFFSGDGMITIFSEVLEIAMRDLGIPWNVKHIPKHKI